MNEPDKNLRRQQAEWKAPEQPITRKFESASEQIALSSFSEWCKLNNNPDYPEPDMNAGMSISEKEKIYDAVFREGQRKLVDELRDPSNDKIKLVDKLDLPALKAEVDALRKNGDTQVLGAKEEEISNIFQNAISEYPYDMGTCHIADILGKKKMNCVGASVLGGALLDEAGIKYLVGHFGNHVMLVVVTSDKRILWQDMQDGLERPELENEELTAENISGTTPNDIADFADKPTKAALSFLIKKEVLKGEPMTVTQPNVGLEIQELISTGFILGNNGRNEEALEILQLARYKSPNDANVHQGMARAYKNQKRYSDAIEAYKSALEIDPNSVYLQEELADVQKLVS